MAAELMRRLAREERRWRFGGGRRKGNGKRNVELVGWVVGIDCG